MTPIAPDAPIRGIKLAIGLLLLFALGVAAYWTSFFTGGDVQVNQDACYIVFERTFPAPDGATAFFALLSAVGLIKREGWAVLWGLVAAGGIIFLGLIDVSYNVWGGMYKNVSAAMLAENVINIYCVIVGPWLIAFLWRSRKALGA